MKQRLEAIVTCMLGILNIVQAKELSCGGRLLFGQRRIHLGPDDCPEAGKPFCLGFQMAFLGLANSDRKSVV